ncbi:ets DNA-binding protein pokkuri-like isoform X1 [Pomacea canaliculata]|uniref:ets DNA-binding protein pokkuri-like isoform X1 n=2 Tax=Pomacea canaliculata TaxID=400727 RepID=UPI000D73D67A|nr:ets DNA-binding protein pokkuri-like isoform X1 [Pomacea canaliculata]
MSTLWSTDVVKMEADMMQFYRRMPELLDMSTAALISTVPLLPDYDAVYPPVVPADIGMEGIRRAIISVEELDTISLNPLQEATMGYEDYLPLSGDICQLTLMGLHEPESSPEDQRGYLDNNTGCGTHRDYSPGSTGDNSCEQELSDSAGSEECLPSSIKWETVAESYSYDTPLPDVSIFKRAPPPPQDDFLGQGRRRPEGCLVKRELPDSGDESLDTSFDNYCDVTYCGSKEEEGKHQCFEFQHCTFHTDSHRPYRPGLPDDNNNYAKSTRATSTDTVTPPGEGEKCQRKKPGRKKGQVSKVLHLWEFIRDLLCDPEHCPRIISWENEREGVFRVVHSTEVARLWGEKKNNKKTMTYEKLSRSLRYSRREGYFAALPKDKGYPKKLCFKFGPKSHGWRDSPR